LFYFFPSKSCAILGAFVYLLGASGAGSSDLFSMVARYFYSTQVNSALVKRISCPHAVFPGGGRVGCGRGPLDLTQYNNPKSWSSSHPLVKKKNSKKGLQLLQPAKKLFAI